MSREKALAAAPRAVAEVLREKGRVTMVDVFVAMGRLTPAQVEDRQLSPVLLPEDIERLARRLRVPNPEFRASHLRKEGGGFVFARLPCPLLDGTRCSCYRDRPRDCRSYPHLHKKDMTSRLLAVLGNAAACPIVFSTVERLKEELVERGFDWRAGGREEVPS